MIAVDVPQQVVCMAQAVERNNIDMGKTFQMFPKDGQTEKVRPMAVAGTFYPAGKKELEAELATCFGNAVPSSGGVSRAVIVPHAGYVFSGGVAACGYSQIPSGAHFERVFILGPAHKAYVDGASIDTGFDFYHTPLGDIPVDTALCRQLAGKYPFFNGDPMAHRDEHCIEVQLPFLQKRLKDCPPIVPIIIGTEDAAVLRSMAEALLPYFNERNLFVISSDFSHYPAYKDAVKADSCTGAAIGQGSPEAFLRALAENRAEQIPNLVTSACGQAGIYLLLTMMKGLPFDIRHIEYKNSGDAPYGERNRVVGYHAFAVYRDSTQFSLSAADKTALLSLARETIKDRLEGKKRSTVDTSSLSAALKTHCGAFVTLHCAGSLRGCIGRFGDREPLYRVVVEMAAAAAFEDPRFPPLKQNELPNVDIEISVLTPMKRIHSADEFQLGKQGIYILKGTRGGTYLPQVAAETGWTKEEFLDRCAREKAGLAPGEWKSAELYTYEAIVFHE